MAFEDKTHIRKYVSFFMLYLSIYLWYLGSNEDLMKKQRLVAIISEMIHTASLIHDDILGNKPLTHNISLLNSPNQI